MGNKNKPRHRDEKFSKITLETAERLGLRRLKSLEILEHAFKEDERHHSHRRILVASFIGGGKLTMQIFSDDKLGLNLTLQEILASTGQVFPLTAGPFAVAVTDSNPAGSVSVTPGSDDQTTPTNFKPNGTGALATISVVVTDQSNKLVSAPASFDIVAPVAKPDTLIAGFTPAGVVAAAKKAA